MEEAGLPESQPTDDQKDSEAEAKRILAKYRGMPEVNAMMHNLNGRWEVWVGQTNVYTAPEPLIPFNYTICEMDESNDRIHLS